MSCLKMRNEKIIAIFRPKVIGISRKFVTEIGDQLTESFKQESWRCDWSLIDLKDFYPEQRLACLTENLMGATAPDNQAT